MSFTTPEPERQVVAKSTIPPADRMNLPKGFWDAVVAHLHLLGPGEALACEMPPGHFESGRSSLNNASAKAGVRVSIVHRRGSLYCWIVGRRPVSNNARPPRKQIACRVCGRAVTRPRAGGSVQFYCTEVGRRSACQVVARTAALRGESIDAVKRRSRRWMAERGLLRGDRAA